MIETEAKRNLKDFNVELFYHMFWFFCQWTSKFYITSWILGTIQRIKIFLFLKFLMTKIENLDESLLKPDYD